MKVLRKLPVTGAHSTAIKANGDGRPARDSLEGDEGFSEAREDSSDGFSEPLPSQLVKAKQQRTATGKISVPRLGETKLGQRRPIHVNTARFLIALLSLATLVFVVVMSFVTLWRASVPVENLMRLLEVLFAPLVALVGVAVAFYYRGNPPLG